MSLRRRPNPNRNHPLYCPYCAGEQLFPDTESEFAWLCEECMRVFEVRYFGQDDPPQRPAPAPSTNQALTEHLRKHKDAP